MRRPLPVRLLGALLGCAQPAAPPAHDPGAAEPPRFAALVDSLREAHALPALAAAVVGSEGVRHAHAAGVRRAGGATAVTPADPFHLGSDTKAMTAALVGVLVDEGRLAWTTPLRDALPDLAPAMHPAWREVTVLELLTHTAGAAADPPAPPPAPDARAQRRAVAERALREPPRGPRGAFAYSNLGYILAGAAAEHAGGRPYEELLTERVLRPLGVTTAGFGAMGTPGRDDAPLQHAVDAAGRRTAVPPGPDADNPPAYSPAGRAHMSVGDWGRFAAAVLAAARGAASPWRAETARRLVTPAADAGGGAGYAPGWLVVQRPWSAGPALTHAGSNTLSYAVAWLAPGRDVGVLVATNQGGDAAARAADAVAARLLQFALDGR